MTHMQTPYDESDVTLYAESERTSVMAILSMVFGIGGCCLGITSIPAILLGILGLVGISRSKGRVGGTGFGIAGILIGLLTLALWGGIVGAFSFGINKSFVPMSEKVSAILLDVQSDQFDSARNEFSPPTDQASDEALTAFREEYRSTLGDFVSKPKGLGEWLNGYMTMGQSMQSMSGRNDLIPLPMQFDSGWGLVLYQIDPPSKSQTGGMPNPITLIVIDPDGNIYEIAPPESIGDESEADAVDEPMSDEPSPDPSDEPADGSSDEP
ncbi:MAG: DUF4190 domain-containing protein [Phycisphaerales bacterium]